MIRDTIRLGRLSLIATLVLFSPVFLPAQPAQPLGKIKEIHCTGLHRYTTEDILAATGLVIALFTLVAYNYLNQAVKDLIFEMESAASRFLEARKFARRREL